MSIPYFSEKNLGSKIEVYILVSCINVLDQILTINFTIVLKCLLVSSILAL